MIELLRHGQGQPSRHNSLLNVQSLFFCQSVERRFGDCFGRPKIIFLFFERRIDFDPEGFYVSIELFSLVFQAFTHFVVGIGNDRGGEKQDRKQGSDHGKAPRRQIKNES
ncbi:hypothetical protein [Zavarzinella formosa]|uniref:hypothetical protein n=1 Tax=Zavarzinella formosa TaxID=360055 RepID=UPI0012F73D04|nr:hypothetical protein [Zavarzinella formosa]